MQIDKPDYFGQILHKKGFRAWFLYMFRAIEGRKFIVEPIHADLFNVFQDIYDNKILRQSINIPPRSAKTTFAKYFVAYTWAVNPKANFIYTSFSRELLSDISRELINILKHSMYIAMYDTGAPPQEEEEITDPIDNYWRQYLLSINPQAIFTSKKIVTASGGVAIFPSIGSTITGFGAGIRGAVGFSGALIIDDANKPIDIRSQVIRKKVQEYYVNTLLSRTNDSNVPIINIQQRLHVDDLSGFLEKEYNFEILKKPLLVNNICQIPSQYDERRLIEIQKNDSMFFAQYQQSPILDGGNLFKINTIRELERSELPLEKEYSYRFITADLSYKGKEKNDFTVFSYWGVKSEIIQERSRDHLYLIDVMRKKINAVDVDEWIIEWIKRKIQTYNFRYIYIEDKSHGIYLNQDYRKKGFPIPTEEMLKQVLPRDADKVTRAKNVIPALDPINPNVSFCKDIENYTDIKEELIAFDEGVHDDFVDTFIDAVRISLCVPNTSIFDVL